MKNARSVGGERGGKIYVKNAYTGRQLRIDTSSIRHGLNGGINRLLTNARLGAVIGNVVQNAVPVNALYNKAKGVTGTYAMAAYANDSRNREFVAIVTVEQRSGDISGLESYDVTHAVSGRQKNSSQADTKSQGVYPIKAAKISIADFLSIVNSTHQSVLSDDVLQHFRESRNPNGDYSGRVKFSPRESGEEMRDGVVAQEITSDKTSIKQVAGLFKDKNAKFGKTNIDVGGGRFNLVTDYLAERGTKNMVFDPYNRGVDENTATLRYLQNGGRADTATCANVLNVIREPDARANVILEVAKCIRDGGTAYFTVYEGDGSGEGRQTSSGWQNNRKTADYVSEIGRYFDDVQRKGKLIIVTNPKENLPKASWEVEPGRGVRFSVRDYSYEILTAKPDMRVTNVDDSVPYRPAREARKEIVARAIANAKKIGRTNENGNAVVRVADTGDEVILSAKGLRHGLDRRFSVNAPVTLKAGEIIRNAIRINEFTPENAQADASYALIGAAKNAKNEPYIVQFVVNRISNEVTDVDVLYAVNAKKEPGALLPDVTGTDAPAILTDSVISIRSLLDYVNRYFPDVLPESVLRHYNHDRRPEGKLGESALYQRRDDARTDRDVLSDAVDGDAGCSAIWTEYKSSGYIAWMQPLLFCAGFSRR